MCSLFKTLLSLPPEPGLKQLVGLSGSVGSRAAQGVGWCWVSMGLCLQGLWGGKTEEGPVVRVSPAPTGPCAQPLCPPPVAASSLDPFPDISCSGFVSYMLGLMFFENDLKSN